MKKIDTIIVEFVEHADGTDGRDKNGHIRGIAGKDQDGAIWQLSEAEAIYRIKKAVCQFYVSVNGRASLLIVKSRDGHEYLKTGADGINGDDLLRLPRIP